MSGWKKLAAAPAGGAGINLEEVFSTYRYEGFSNGNPVTVSNGIDLYNEGGLVWVKNTDPNATTNHVLTSTSGSAWYSNAADAEATNTSYAPRWNTNGNGFNIPNAYAWTNTDKPINSFTWRNCPNFFQEVRYTGNGVSGRTVSHGLGSVPGMMIVKRTDGVGNARVYHRSLGPTKNMFLGESSDQRTESDIWNNTAPTSTEFTVGNSGNVNGNGYSYVAYLFAHHNGDGTFGPNGNEDVIKCGTYNGNNAGDYYDAHQIGFKPQFFMIKCIDYSNTNWVLWNKAAPFGEYDAAIFPNNENGENNQGCEPSGDGVYLKSGSATINQVGRTYIYLAIAEGTKVPELPSEVFDTQYVSGTGGTGKMSFDFSPDLWWRKYNGTWLLYDRSHYLWDKYSLNQMYPSNNNYAQTSVSNFDSNTPFNYSDHINLTNYYEYNGSSYNYYDYVLKAAPQFMTTVRWRGNGQAGRTVAHNLKAVPDVIMVRFQGSNGWEMYYGDNTKYVSPSYSTAAATSSTRWNNTSPTDTHFTLGTDGGVNNNGSYYKAWLFKALPGISDMGTYTGNGTSQTITTSLLNTPRFIMIKNLGGNDHWWVYDSNRGIVAGDDPAFRWNTSNNVYNTDAVDPLSNGFSVTSYSGVNSNGYEFFYICFA